jgi:hypothetical protein
MPTARSSPPMARETTPCTSDHSGAALSDPPGRTLRPASRRSALGGQRQHDLVDTDQAVLPLPRRILPTFISAHLCRGFWRWFWCGRQVEVLRRWVFVVRLGIVTVRGRAVRTFFSALAQGWRSRHRESYCASIYFIIVAIMPKSGRSTILSGSSLTDLTWAKLVCIAAGDIGKRVVEVVG